MQFYRRLYSLPRTVITPPVSTDSGVFYAYYRTAPGTTNKYYIYVDVSRDISITYTWTLAGTTRKGVY